MTAALRLSICPDNQWEDFRATVRRAPLFEQAGFDVLWLGDHVLPFQHSRGFNRSVLVEMAAYLACTKTVHVGGQVISPIGLRRQPIDVALDLATLALLHPGRVELTVGTGEAANERNVTGQWPSPQERVARCVEAMQLIRRAWSDRDYFTFDGEYFKSFFHLYVLPDPPISLTCAANGPVMANRAGRFADGFCCVGVSVEHFRDTLVPAFDRGATEAGRDPASLEKMVWIPTSYHPKASQALAAARLEAGVLVPGALEDVTDPREMEALGMTVDEATIRSASCVSSTAQEIVDTFSAYIDAGATHIIWGDLSPDPDLIPPLAAHSVLPALRR